MICVGLIYENGRALWLEESAEARRWISREIDLLAEMKRGNDRILGVAAVVTARFPRPPIGLDALR